jgi:hypothetical protein
VIIGWGNMCRPTFFLRPRPTTSQTQSPLQVQRAKGGQTRGLVTPIGCEHASSSSYGGGKTGFLPKSFLVRFRSSFPFLCNLPSPLPTLLQQYLCTGGWSVGPFAFTCCVVVKIPPKYLGSLTKWQPTKSYLQHPDRCPQLLLSSNVGQSTGHAQPGQPQLWALLPSLPLSSLLPYPCSFRSFVATRGQSRSHHCSHCHAARKHKGRRKRAPMGLWRFPICKVLSVEFVITEHIS